MSTMSTIPWSSLATTESATRTHRDSALESDRRLSMEMMGRQAEAGNGLPKVCSGPRTGNSIGTMLGQDEQSGVLPDVNDVVRNRAGAGPHRVRRVHDASCGPRST